MIKYKKNLFKTLLVFSSFLGATLTCFSLTQCKTEEPIQTVNLQTVVSENDIYYFNPSLYENKSQAEDTLRDLVFAKNKLYKYGDSTELNVQFAIGSDSTAILSHNEFSKHFTGRDVEINFIQPTDGKQYTDNGVYFNDTIHTAATPIYTEITDKTLYSEGVDTTAGNLQVTLGTQFTEVLQNKSSSNIGDVFVRWDIVSSDPTIAQVIHVPGQSDPDKMQIITGQKTGLATIFLYSVNLDPNLNIPYYTFHSLKVSVNEVNNTLTSSASFSCSQDTGPYPGTKMSESYVAHSSAFTLTRNGINVIKKVEPSGVKIGGSSNHFFTDKVENYNNNPISSVIEYTNPFDNEGIYTEKINITQGLQTMKLDYIDGLDELYTTAQNAIISTWMHVYPPLTPWP